MLSIRGSALLGAMALLLPSAAAMAADLGAIYYEEPVATPYEIGSNWYLRGDIGYKWYGTPDASYNVNGYGDMIDESLAPTGLAGIGFGYRFNDSFRSDVTIDYEWESEFKGKLSCPNPCTGKPGKEYSKEYANIEAWSGLVNAYWDFGLGGEGIAGVIPYVGAGIGVSSLTTSKVSYTNPNGTTGTWKGATTTNLAWAVMAGVSVPITNNWLVDLNYRYMDLGDAQSGKTIPALGNKRIKYDDITASEVRVGFRYQFD